MRQNMVAQLERALNLLLPRFSDAFFVQAEVTMRTAQTEQQLLITGDAHGYTLQHKQHRENLRAPGLIPYLAEAASKADALELRLIRRNETVLVVADNKGTKVRLEKPLGTQSAANEPLDIPETEELLRVLGFTDNNGALRPGEMRKYHQINQYLKAAAPVLKQLASEVKEFTVIDAACGKSHLSFVLNFYLTQVLHCKVHMIGMDISPEVIATAQEMSIALGYRNTQYVHSSVADFRYDSQIPVGLVVSLHACDTATDEAIALGVRFNSRAMIMVPCCQRELLGQLQLQEQSQFLAPMLRQGHLKAKFADLLTDSIRCLALQANGYQVSVQEFCSPIDTPKNTMLRATQNASLDYRAHVNRANREYTELRKQFDITPQILHPLFVSVQESGV